MLDSFFGEDKDPIVAEATPVGRGGVSIVRLSGPTLTPFVKSIFHLESLTPRLATRVSVWADGSIIDEALAIYFKNPHSYTGEDVLEIQLHGNPVLVQETIKVCRQAGARLAKPGEFTMRAFLNSKMDLVQAEAVADLINAESQVSARMALSSLKGFFSKQVHQLEENLIQLRVFVEAAIDFSDEEIDFLQQDEVKNSIQFIRGFLEELLGEASESAVFREHHRVVVLGAPNVGKSSLMNALAEDEVAIVTDLAGTTRDLIKETIALDGHIIELIDTAGLRATDDLVELVGIKKAKMVIAEAACLLVIASIEDLPANPKAYLKALELELSEEKMIWVVNKVDLNPALQLKDPWIGISAVNGKGLDALKKKMLAFLTENEGRESRFFARQRHIESLELALNELENAEVQIQKGAPELVAEHLRQMQDAMNTITGDFTSDDLLGRIFSSFCIGK